MKQTLFIICFLILQSCSDNDGNAYYEKFDMPIYPSARNILVGADSYIMAKTVNYDLQSSISPNELFNHYNQKLLSFDFQENIKHTFYDNSISDTEFIADGDWKQPPAIYHKGWLNSDKNTIIRVSIYYRPENLIHVGILMHPNVNAKLLNDLKSLLDKPENERAFHELLSKYPGSDNALDLQKALKQEPTNPTLIKYATIEEQSRIELEANYREFNK